VKASRVTFLLAFLYKDFTTFMAFEFKVRMLKIAQALAFAEGAQKTTLLGFEPNAFIRFTFATEQGFYTLIVYANT
jgi:hypothetical protein